MSNFKALLKKTLKKSFPALWTLIHSFNIYCYFRKKYWKQQKYFFAKLFPKKDAEILRGPFAGMRYANFVSWGPLMSRWLGSYESELSDVVNYIIENEYEKIIDIGSAEGYYAIGLAKKLEKSMVYAFDNDPRARFFCRYLAKKNGVQNIAILSECSPELLMKISGPKTAIICDIEGYELPLFEAIQPDLLSGTDMLIEIHPFLGNSSDKVGEFIEKCFKDTHQIQRIEVQIRDYIELAGEYNLTLDEARICMDEGRSDPQFWLWLKSNA